jgi:hypothetical protein
MTQILPGTGRLNNPKLLDRVRAVSRLKHGVDAVTGEGITNFFSAAACNSPSASEPMRSKASNKAMQTCG